MALFSFVDIRQDYLQASRMVTALSNLATLERHWGVASLKWIYSTDLWALILHLDGRLIDDTSYAVMISK